MNISKRADQTVGFEVEIQNLQLKNDKNENKILLAESDKKINGKPAFYFVTDGAGGAPTVYIEVVSAPMKTVEDVRNYIKTVRQICSIGKKSPQCLCRTTLVPLFQCNIHRRQAAIK